MKKFLTVLTVITLVLVVSGCGKKSNTTTTTEPIEHDPVTITYADWGLGDPANADKNLERLMLKAFQEKYSWITVQVIERPKIPDPNNENNQIDMNWNEFLAAQASKGRLPDVFSPDNIPLSIENRWVYDINSIAKDDAEFNNVSSDITNAGKYGDKLFVLPKAVNYFGYLVNKDIFENANKDYPQFGVEWNDFIADIKAVASHTDGGNGVAGYDGVEHIMHWYPAQLNKNVGWFTYDGEKLNLTDPSFKTAIELQHQLLVDKSFVVDALSDEEVTNMFGLGRWELFDKGREAVKFDGSWAISNIKASMDNGNISKFNYDFIGTPAVDGTNRVPINIDFLAIGSDTRHPEEAYLLAKWMGFGHDGYAKRLELSTTVEGINPINFAPLQPDKDLLDSFFNVYPGFDEFRKVVEHGKYIVEPNKFLPGYIDARYTAQFDADNNMWSIFNKLWHNEITFADYISEINTKANQALHDAYEKIKDTVDMQ